MEEERGEVWLELRHGQHSCCVVSYPAKKDRIISVQREEEDIAEELLGLCRANSTLSTQELKSICKTKGNAMKRGVQQQQEDRWPAVASPSSRQGRSSGVVIAGADASLVAPLALSGGGGAGLSASAPTCARFAVAPLCNGATARLLCNRPWLVAPRSPK